MRTFKNIWKLNRFLYREGMLFQFWYYYWTIRDTEDLVFYGEIKLSEERWYLQIFLIEWHNTLEGSEHWAGIMSRAREEYKRKSLGL